MKYTAALGLLTIALLAACGEGDGDENAPSLPAASTPEAILAFIDERGFEAADWRAETEAPRLETTAVSPHDDVRVYQNTTLIESRTPEGGYAVDSMAVKAIYEGDEVVGHAAMWLEAGQPSFTYFCYGPRNRCGLAETETPRDDPIFGRGIEVVCGHCHGGVIFTEIPP